MLRVESLNDIRGELRSFKHCEGAKERKFSRLRTSPDCTECDSIGSDTDSLSDASCVDIPTSLKSWGSEGSVRSLGSESPLWVFHEFRKTISHVGLVVMGMATVFTLSLLSFEHTSTRDLWVFMFAWMTSIMAAGGLCACWFQDVKASIKRSVIDQALEVREDSLKEFARLIHDLKSPMAVLCNEADELIAALPPESFKHADIKDSAELMRTMSNVISIRTSAHSISKFAGKTYTLTLCFKTEINRAALMYRSLFTKTSVQYEVINNIPENLSCLFPADAIRRCLENLIGNALKFTVVGSITVEAFVEDSVALIRVTDTGKGVPHDQKLKIFEGTQLQHSSGGLGLGLQSVTTLADSVKCFDNPCTSGAVFECTFVLKNAAIEVGLNNLDDPVTSTSSIIHDDPCTKRTHSKIDFVDESSSGVELGSTVVFERQAAAESIQAKDNSAEVVSNVKGNSNIEHFSASFARPRVLLVEDDRLQLRLLMRKVSMIAPQFQVSHASNGAAGLEMLLESGPFDLVISDMHMHTMDGFSMVVKAIEAGVIAASQCVIVSANPDQVPKFGGSVQDKNGLDVSRFLLPILERYAAVSSAA